MRSGNESTPLSSSPRSNAYATSSMHIWGKDADSCSDVRQRVDTRGECPTVVIHKPCVDPSTLNKVLIPLVRVSLQSFDVTRKGFEVDFIGVPLTPSPLVCLSVYHVKRSSPLVLTY